MSTVTFVSIVQVISIALKICQTDVWYLLYE